MIPMPKDKNKDDDPDSKWRWYKPVNLTVIAVALIGGFSPSGGVGAIADVIRGQDQIDCAVELDRAFDLYDSDPTVRILVTGPAQDQCKVNEAVERYSTKKQ